MHMPNPKERAVRTVFTLVGTGVILWVLGRYWGPLILHGRASGLDLPVPSAEIGAIIAVGVWGLGIVLVLAVTLLRRLSGPSVRTAMSGVTLGAALLMVTLPTSAPSVADAGQCTQPLSVEEPVGVCLR